LKLRIMPKLLAKRENGIQQNKLLTQKLLTLTLMFICRWVCGGKKKIKQSATDTSKLLIPICLQSMLEQNQTLSTGKQIILFLINCWLSVPTTNSFIFKLIIKVTWRHKCKTSTDKNSTKWCNQKLKTKKLMAEKVKKLN
jgi:hypothetical protein